MKREQLKTNLGITIGVVGIALSVYFYQKSQKDKDLVFIVDPNRFELLNHKNIENSPIKIFSNDVEINNDVSSAKIHLWNRGKEPIRNTDILENIVIELGDNAKILDIKNTQVSRPVSRINLSKVDDNKILVDFLILEENDGFSAQIIYIGDKEVNFKLHQTIIGVKNHSSNLVTEVEYLKLSLKNILRGILILFFFIIAGILTNFRSRKDEFLLTEHNDFYQTDEVIRSLIDQYLANVESSTSLRKSIEVRMAELRPEKKQISTKSRKNIFLFIVISLSILILISLIMFLIEHNSTEIHENISRFLPETIKTSK